MPTMNPETKTIVEHFQSNPDEENKNLIRAYFSAKINIHYVAVLF